MVYAGVVELVDTLDLGSSAIGMGVRVPPPAFVYFAFKVNKNAQ